MRWLALLVAVAVQGAGFAPFDVGSMAVAPPTSIADLTRKALSGADFRVELADTIGGALDTAVGVITAFPPPEEPISLAVYVGSIATGHVASLGCSAWAIIELHAGD